MNNTKWWTSATLALVLLIGGGSVAIAFGGNGMGMKNEDCMNRDRAEMPMDRHLEKMTEIFDLSSDQQAKIKQIMTDHHAQADNTREKMHAARMSMMQQKGTAFNEEEVRQAAELSGAAHTERMISRANMQHEIDAVLTVEQRELSEKFAMLQCDGDGSGHRDGKMHRGMRHGCDQDN